MSARKSSHRTIFLIVSSGSPLALIASSLRSISKKPVCPMTRSFHPPMVHCNQRVRFAATWREEFFEVPLINKFNIAAFLVKCCTAARGTAEYRCYGAAAFSLCSNRYAPSLGQPPLKSYRDFNEEWSVSSWEVTEPAGFQAQYIRVLAKYVR